MPLLLNKGVCYLPLPIHHFKFIQPNKLLAAPPIDIGVIELVGLKPPFRILLGLQSFLCNGTPQSYQSTLDIPVIRTRGRSIRKKRTERYAMNWPDSFYKKKFWGKEEIGGKMKKAEGKGIFMSYKVVFGKKIEYVIFCKRWYKIGSFCSVN